MRTSCTGYLIDEKSGVFDDRKTGEQVYYHNAQFYDAGNRNIMKVRLQDDSPALPPVKEDVTLHFEVTPYTSYTRIDYLGYEAL